jgi:hypothetical protein
MADAHVAQLSEHVPGVKNVAYQPIILPQEELRTGAGHHSSGILATMLKHSQSVKKRLADQILRHDADDTAHIFSYILG